MLPRNPNLTSELLRNIKRGTAEWVRGCYICAFLEKKKVIHPFLKQYAMLIQVGSMTRKAVKPN